MPNPLLKLRIWVPWLCLQMPEFSWQINKGAQFVPTNNIWPSDTQGIRPSVWQTTSPQTERNYLGRGWMENCPRQKKTRPLPKIELMRTLEDTHTQPQPKSGCTPRKLSSEGSIRTDHVPSRTGLRTGYLWKRLPFLLSPLALKKTANYPQGRLIPSLNTPPIPYGATHTADRPFQLANLSVLCGRQSPQRAGWRMAGSP